MKNKLTTTFLFLYYISANISSYAVDGSRYGRPSDFDDRSSSGKGNYIFLVIIIIAIVIGLINRNKKEN